MTISPFLILHISGGAVGLLSGTAALIFRKGSRLHRAAGNVFFIAMLCMSASGAYLAYMKSETVNFVMGLLAFYLVATAWATVKRKEGEMGLFEWGSVVIALAITIGMGSLGWYAATSPSGKIDGFPVGFYMAWATIALLSMIGDIRVLVKGGISGVSRIARHVWRMCFAFFIANASLFLGQPQVFPESVRGTLVLASPVLAVIVLTIFWFVRVKFTSWYDAA